MTSAVEVEVLSSQAGRSSAYLLRHGSTSVLVDCGPGTSAALERSGRLDDLDAIVITHQHADHAADVIGLAYARCFPEPLPKVPLHAPAATLDTLRQLDDLFAVPTLPAMGNTIDTSFELHALPMDGTTTQLLRVGADRPVTSENAWEPRDQSHAPTSEALQPTTPPQPEFTCLSAHALSLDPPMR